MTDMPKWETALKYSGTPSGDIALLHLDVYVHSVFMKIHGKLNLFWEIWQNVTTVPVVGEVGMGAAGAMGAMHSEKKIFFGTFKYTQVILLFYQGIVKYRAK